MVEHIFLLNISPYMWYHLLDEYLSIANQKKKMKNFKPLILTRMYLQTYWIFEKKNPPSSNHTPCAICIPNTLTKCQVLECICMWHCFRVQDGFCPIQAEPLVKRILNFQNKQRTFQFFQFQIVYSSFFIHTYIIIIIYTK